MGNATRVTVSAFGALAGLAGIEHGGPVLILLSIVMLLVGGGFGPPIPGIILGASGTRINAPLTWWRTHLSSSSRRFLANLCPWCFVAGVIVWLFLLPGTILLDHFVGVNNPYLIVPILTFSAFGLLLLTVFAGFAYDIQRQTGWPIAKGDHHVTTARQAKFSILSPEKMSYSRESDEL